MTVEIVPSGRTDALRNSSRRDVLALASARLDARLPALAPALAARWRARLDELGAGAAVRANLARLERGAACVVTGQQCGLLGGPWLTALKAARAVSLARELETASGRPVVPVFWCASDDHDLDEIHHTFVLNRAGEVQKLRLELGDARGAAGEVAVPEGAPRLVRELFDVAAIEGDALAAEPFLPAAGDSLSTWFARVLLELFGGLGLVPFDPALAAGEARPLFERALRDGAAVASALRRGADALRDAGLVPPLPLEDDPPLFVIEPGARTRVRRAGAAFKVGDRDATLDQLLELAREGVPRLSGNVALRPLLQAALLPCIAYVGGPSEGRYLAQLAPLHDSLSQIEPAFVPRPEATVLPVAVARSLRKLGVAPRELFAALDARARAGAPSAGDGSPPPALLRRGRELRADVGRWLEELRDHSPAMRSAVARRASQAGQALDALLERAAASFAESDEASARRFRQIENAVRPRGRPQDRVLNFLPLLAGHGRGLIDDLLELRGEPEEGAVVPHALLFQGPMNDG